MALRSDSCVIEGFVSVDVAYAVKEGLAEQCGLDWCFSAVEERDEVFERDCERLAAGALIHLVRYGEAAEATGVDEANFFSTTQGEDGVGVRGYLGLRRGDEEAAGHAQVDEELGRSSITSEVDGDRLADTMDSVDAGSSERIGDVGWRRLEGLGLVARPDAEDGLALNALVNSIRYCFDFRKLRHGSFSMRQ